MFSQMAEGFGYLENTDLYNTNANDFDDLAIFDQEEKESVVETISPILTVAIPPFANTEFGDDSDPFMSSISTSSYSLDVSLSEPQLSPSSLVGTTSSSFDSTGQLGTPTESIASYVRQPRQGRYSKSRSSSVSSQSSDHSHDQQQQQQQQQQQHQHQQQGSCEHKKVSDSRLSAQGLAKVLKLDSPEEALKRERYILDIFENELHYPLGYKTWVRDTFKDSRVKLIDQLHERVKHRYPEYDHSVLETIIRRATYYMMQSRLRRERRARAKGIKCSRSNASSPSI